MVLSTWFSHAALLLFLLVLVLVLVLVCRRRFIRYTPHLPLLPIPDDQCGEEMESPEHTFVEEDEEEDEEGGDGDGASQTAMGKLHARAVAREGGGGGAGGEGKGDDEDAAARPVSQRVRGGGRLRTGKVRWRAMRVRVVLQCCCTVFCFSICVRSLCESVLMRMCA